jgi:hypothetical protein
VEIVDELDASRDMQALARKLWEQRNSATDAKSGLTPREGSQPKPQPPQQGAAGPPDS